MPRISTCTDTITDDTNVPTKDDKYPWLNPDKKGKEEFLKKQMIFMMYLVLGMR